MLIWSFCTKRSCLVTWSTERQRFIMPREQQHRFLLDAGVDDVSVLQVVHFHLAPLFTRWDMAMLGLIELSWGKGPVSLLIFSGATYSILRKWWSRVLLRGQS